jgi:type II secretory pathway pseudopilin PulG
MNRAARRRLETAAGFSLIEATVVIVLALLLASVVAPTIGDCLEDVRRVRARQDLTTLAASIIRLFDHTWSQRHTEGGFATYNLLVGPGSVPAAVRAEAKPWNDTSPRVGLLRDQLVRNVPYPAFRPGARGGWRGSYQDSIDADPWGRRYAVNVRTVSMPRSDLVALTAGPDGVADSPFDADGLAPAGDDMMTAVGAEAVRASAEPTPPLPVPGPAGPPPWPSEGGRWR